MKLKEKTNGLINFQDLKKPRYVVLYTVFFLILTCLAIACVVPVLWVIISSIKPTEEMYRIPPTILPETYDLGIWKSAWEKVQFGRYFVNSGIIIVGAWACDVFFNGICGYTLSRIKPKGSSIMESALLWTLLISGISMVPLYETIVSLGGINHYWPLWLMCGCNAFNVMLFRKFFNGIPISYIEAARMDGLSEIGIFFKIIIPLSMPVIMVVSIFSFTGQWSNFMWPYIVLSGDKVPVSVKLYMISSSQTMGDNEKMSVMLFAIIPPAVVYCLFSKRIVGGVSMEGIKG